MFGIDDAKLMDPNYIKILNGIAGSGKSTETVNTLNGLGSNFCLASFSNALKFAAGDKFGCPVDTICGLAFINNPFPRSDEKDVTEFDTVVLDEILLDGAECIEWMKHHVGTVNIIALTDSRQMLNASNGRAALRAFKDLCDKDYAIVVDIDKTRRARDTQTEKMYEKLYKLESNNLLSLSEVQKIFKCDVISIDNISFSTDSTYLCHSNAIEHEIYKRYGLNNRRDIPLIPKNHISRNKNFDATKYPICDQITADMKRVPSYLQAANVATPTRFQGKEVAVGDECYFVCEKDSIFTGREIYTVGTRCQSMKSIHIVIIDIPEIKDPDKIRGIEVCEAVHLNMDQEDKSYKCISQSHMNRIIRENGEKDVVYLTDMVMCGDNILYSTLSNDRLMKFAKFEGDELKLNKNVFKAKRTISSVTRKDTTMHFDFMPRAYEIVGGEITPPRITNPLRSTKKDFNKYCDLYSAFPTVLNHASMPAAGYLYENYDKDLLNFYIYNGNVVTKGSIITEELAMKLGDSKYVFSTAKQDGCALGKYTYEQSRKSKESKKKVNKDFLWGSLESGYYTPEDVVKNGVPCKKYVKHKRNNLELVACALWSALCVVMLDAINSIGATEFFVVTDGLYYNGDVDPVIPDWCDYRIEDVSVTVEYDDGEKYHNILKKTYEEPMTEAELKKQRRREYMKKYRENTTDEQRAKNAERMRLSRAAKRGDE